MCFGLVVLVYIMPFSVIPLFLFDKTINPVNLVGLLVSAGIAIQVYLVQKSLSRQEYLRSILVGDVNRIINLSDELMDSVTKFVGEQLTLKNIGPIYRKNRMISQRLNYLKIGLPEKSLPEKELAASMTDCDERFLMYSVYVRTLIYVDNSQFNPSSDQLTDLDNLNFHFGKSLRLLLIKIQNLK